MEIKLSEIAQSDLEYWRKSGNKVVLKRIRELTESILQAPFSGIGKPEPLKHNWAGYWSRRINKEHRLIYKVTSNELFIAALRYHY